MQGWTDVSVTHFRDLGVFGEQLCCRSGTATGASSTTRQAANWARYWRPEIQRYTHAYRAATGVDLDPGYRRHHADLPAAQPAAVAPGGTALTRRRCLDGLHVVAVSRDAALLRRAAGMGRAHHRRPAVLGRSAAAGRVSALLAALQGADRAVLVRSSLHAFADCLPLLTGRGSGLVVDAATYPIGRWATQRSAALGVPVTSVDHQDIRDLTRALDGWLPADCDRSWWPTGCAADAPGPTRWARPWT